MCTATGVCTIRESCVQYSANPTRREQLKRHYNLSQYKLNVSMEDLASFDAQLADRLTRLPADYLPLVRPTPFLSSAPSGDGVCVCVV